MSGEKTSVEIEDVKTYTDVVQLVAADLGRVLGSPWMKAYSMFLSGHGGMAASFSDLMDKKKNGTAKWNDVHDFYMMLRLSLQVLRF